METGKIKTWIKDRGFGFIADELGEDVFFHISNSQELRGKEDFLVEGAVVVFDKRPSSRRKGQYEAKNVRLQDRAVEASPSSAETHDHFHNPYTFVPSPPRQDAISAGGFAGDFDPLEHDLSHESLKPDLWTGHLPIKLTTVTPLVLPKTEGEERSSDKHQTYDILNHLPESSLRGMLRSAYEVVTNSRYSCFKNDDRLAYRMETREALKLIPAVIENGKGAEELVARLYTGTSHATAQKPNGHGEKGAMYAAMLTRYHRNPNLNSECVGGYEPRTGDEVWAEIELCQHRRGYRFWKAIKVWPKSAHSKEPSTKGKVVKGRVLVTNQNMGNKHDERIFFNPRPDTFEMTDRLKESWRMRIKSYREAHP